MALDTVPWFVGGEAEHSPGVARMLAYSATTGSNGVTQSGDLQVRALDVPGTSVQVYPGGAVLRNDYPGGAHQSYMARNISATEVAIPATGSDGGQTRYVIMRIDDPEFGGQLPADPVVGPYVRFDLVTSITNLAYPHVVLAKIVQPASTGTIEQSMITDMRKLANPREDTIVIARPNVTGDQGFTLNDRTGVGEVFPNSGGSYSLEIPAWATRMQVRGEWLAVRYDTKTGYGKHWIEWGPYIGPSNRQYAIQQFQWDAAENANPYRTNWICHDDVYIPADMRGTTQGFYFKAINNSNATTYPGTPDMDPLSGTVLSVRFMEVADPGAV